MPNDTASHHEHDFEQLNRARAQYRAQLFIGSKTAAKADIGQVAAAATAGSMFYEELGCVGYQPQTNRLEAVVYVNQVSGYGGALCGRGTQEYVRFYASWNNGATWSDLGLAAITVWDIPNGHEGRKRLEYAVSRRHDFQRRICLHPQVVRVRAILSWAVAPPAGQPNWAPVWGNHHDTSILVEPVRHWKLADVLEVADVSAVSKSLLSEALDPAVTIATAPKPLSLNALKSLYANGDVPAKRFGFRVVHQLLTSGVPLSLGSPSAASLASQFGLDLDADELAEILGFADAEAGTVDGDTSYERLECIGYDPTDDSLVGVLRVRRPSGYAGGLCTDGSREYVTFWADLEDSGTFGTCLGTTEVRVYDIAREFPHDGLEFAVHLRADLLRYRQPCRRGAKTVAIRAILSWQVPVSCADPNHRPVWGNRLETRVHIRPGNIFSGALAPLLSSVGGIPVTDIDAAGHAQNAVAVTTGAFFNDAPFGGRINIAGKIVNGDASSRYRVMIREHGIGSFVPLNLEPVGFPTSIVTWPPLLITTIQQHVGSDGYYAYQDYASNHYVESNILAVWQTGAADHGLKFDLRVDIKDPGNPAIDIQSDVVVVKIDNRAPDVTLHFTGLPGDCAHFDLTAKFTGNFTVTDDHFGGFSFSIEPSGPAHGVLPVPPSGASVHLGGVIADPGMSAGSFTLDTTGMDACGYALILSANDRSNINSGQTNNSAQKSVGFCLGSPPAG